MLSSGEKMCLQEINNYVEINIFTVLTLFSNSAKDCWLYLWFYQFPESLFQSIILIFVFVALDSEFKAPATSPAPVFMAQSYWDAQNGLFLGSSF